MGLNSTLYPVEPMCDDSPLEIVSTSEPHGEVDKASELDPSGLGFMCGLEIHQQLNTGKLHSRMPSTLFEMGIEDIPSEWKREARNLRAAEGEGGKVDVAARFEARRNRSFVCLLYTSPSPRDATLSRMPSSA